MGCLHELRGSILEVWERNFTPAHITLCNLRTGEQFQEISLVAAKVKTLEQTGKNLVTGEERTLSHTVIVGYYAAGKAARAYENTPDAVVFSPFRDGQIANYDAAEFLFKDFLKRMCGKLRLLKPVLCVRVQERTTQVEERAVIDAGVQAGARKVLLYQESLAALLRAAPESRELRNACVIHIEPQG